MSQPKHHFDLSTGILIADWDGKTMNLCPEKKIRACIERLQEAGIQWAMIGTIHLEEPSSFDLLEGATTVGRIFRSMNMGISSHHCHLATLAPIADGQEAIRRRLEKTVAFCAPLGTDTLVLHLGRVLAQNESHEALIRNFTREREAFGIERVKEVVAENIAYMADLAATEGMRLALENLGHFEPLGSLDILPDIVERIDRPNVGYCLDTGHAHVFGESNLEWLRLMKGKLFTTHLNDNSARLAIRNPDREFYSTQGVDEHLPPGFGTVDWVALIRQLLADNYDGVLNFECKDWKSDAPYRDLVHWWRTCESLAAEQSI